MGSPFFFSSFFFVHSGGIRLDGEAGCGGDFPGMTGGGEEVRGEVRREGERGSSGVIEQRAILF